MESVAGNRGKNEGEKGLAAKKEKNFILDGFSRAGPVTPVLPADPCLSLSQLLCNSAVDIGYYKPFSRFDPLLRGNEYVARDFS